ncbi:MAG: hypothetical protein QM749_08355 [Aquabacterium sp.]
MGKLISTWPRRLALTAIIFMLAFAAAALWLRYQNDSRAPDSPPISDSSIMTTLFAIPGLLAAAALTLTTALVRPASAATSATAEVKATPEVAPAPAFKAQVVGVQWLNPLVRRDYPTEWQLLWTLGVAKPNKNDEEVKEDPKSFSSVQFVSAILGGGDEDSIYDLYFDQYIRKLMYPIRRRYAMNGDYFYTVQPKSPKDWRELHGIHVELAIPVIPKLLPELAAEHVRKAIGSYFSINDVPDLSTANIPADVRVTTGEANAGFTSLSAAMDYLQAHPDKSVWVMSWDSPQFPNSESLSENCTLLILAGPNMNTDREPLAWIARPAATHAKDFETKEGASKAYQAWEAAVRQSVKQADAKVGDIGYLIHDLGMGEVVRTRSSAIFQALTMLTPELNTQEQAFNSAALLGDMRAGSALTNLALAIAWTHQKGKPVLVAGTTEPNDPVAVVVTPPARARVFDPNKDWFRARGEGNAYLPWWGLHKKYDWSKYMQGFSD